MCRQYWAVWTSSWANATDDGRMTNVECPMTKKIQMTNEQTTQEHRRGISAFVLRHSLVIRRSSFVIFTRFVLILLLARHVLFRQTHHKGECRSSSGRDVEKAG